MTEQTEKKVYIEPRLEKAQNVEDVTEGAPVLCRASSWTDGKVADSRDGSRIHGRAHGKSVEQVDRKVYVEPTGEGQRLQDVTKARRR